MNNNKDFAIEVISLHESGFKLVDYQRDLTVVQKLFLNFSYPVYNQHIKSLSENKGNNSNKSKGTVTDPTFEERYKQRIKEKQNIT